MIRWPFPRHPRLTLGTVGPPLLGRSLVLGPREVAHHKALLGTTGSGKSKLLASVFVQLLEQGLPCALIDPHADLATDVLALLSDRGCFRHQQASRQLWYVDFRRMDRYLPFNVLAQSSYAAHQIAQQLNEVCQRVWPSLADGLAPTFENVLLSAVVVLVENRLPLTALPRLLTEKPYRDRLLTRVSDPQIGRFFHQRFDRWGRQAPLMIESTLRRVHLLTFDPQLRYVLGQPENGLDFRRLLDEGISLICNLGGLAEDTQRFLGCLLLVGFETAALARADQPETQRRPYHLLVDEFGMFAAPSEAALARILSLCRKYRLTLWVTAQTWAGHSQHLRGALQNAIPIAFQLGREDAEWAGRQFATYSPYAIKHEVADPEQGDRTHPVYFSLQESFESWTQAFQDLRPREAFVRVDRRTVKVRTPTVPRPRSTQDELAQVMDRYAQLLMTPREQVQSQVDPPGEQPERKTTRREQRPSNQV